MIIPLFVYSISSCTRELNLTKEEKAYLKATDSIKVGLYPYYPPYQFINEQGKIDGIFVDYLKLIENKLGYTFKKVHYMDWSELIQDTRTGQLDVILEIQSTKEKENYLTFFPPIFSSEHVLVTHKDKKEKFLKNYLDKKFILPKEYASTEILLQKYPKLSITTVSNDLKCLELLNEGTYDAYIGPKALVYYLLTNKKLTNLRIRSRVNLKYEPGIATSKRDPKIKEILEKVINSISREERDEVMNNWLFTSVLPLYEQPKFWLYLSLLSILVLSLIAATNRYLKYQIRKNVKELRIAKEKAEQSDRLKSNFIQNISHEIRTPMNSIIGFSELLSDENIKKEEINLYTSTIIKNGENLISIIDSIIEISKLQSKSETVRPVATSLREIIDEIEGLYRTKIEAKEVDFIINCNPDKELIPIVIDKIKVHIILCKLLDNAYKFTDKGFIKVIAVLADKSITMIIKDTGIGISNEYIELIFNDFERLEKDISQNLGGLGLGLAIARMNTLLIGGTLTVQSNLDIGSTFTLTFPYKPITNK
ncbi:transporter substrate-binding domain-containing protein [Aquimarina sp. ERC-38]|uniref:transporter substrate-binding domain-containing protein n=1 Tax=Aquimarina sp. ERC-38 TaxID=2949996 RepID=UPI00224588EF|nr:transporter substrate-binding domain-containing protein [Aquimarina sp. ERC-38]UZO80314.1 transporter substrate-binding domain-containing protein [Aquimarina sp. ERC-38]